MLIIPTLDDILTSHKDRAHILIKAEKKEDVDWKVTESSHRWKRVPDSLRKMVLEQTGR